MHPRKSELLETVGKTGLLSGIASEKNIWFWKDEQGKPILKDTYIYSIYKGNLSYQHTLFQPGST